MANFTLIELQALMTLFVIFLLFTSYICASRLDKRAIDRGFNLNVLPAESPSHSPSPQLESQYEPYASAELSLTLNVSLSQDDFGCESYFFA